MIAKSTTREQFLSQQPIKRQWATLSKEAVGDLKWFAGEAKKGRAASFDSLALWFKQTYGLRIGRLRMATLAREHGFEPWWSYSV